MNAAEAPHTYLTRRTRPWWVHLLVTLAAAGIVIGVGATLLLHFWPTLTYNAFHRQIANGLGTGVHIADNSLHTLPFIASPDIAGESALAKSGNQDGLYTLGWLDLTRGAQTISVPEHGDRYLNVSLIDPVTGVVIGNLSRGGTTTIYHDTCTAHAPCPAPATPAVAAPDNQVLVIGRTYVADQADFAAALAIAQKITVHPTG